jgi:hypothetical protein
VNEARTRLSIISAECGSRPGCAVIPSGYLALVRITI